MLRRSFCLARPTRRGGRRLALAALLIGIIGYSLYVVVGPNLHAVIPGKVYRMAQPSGEALGREIDRHGIRTVINLRGYCPADDWYTAEIAATASRGISQEDITFSARCLPSPTELRRLVEVFDHCEYPVLIHCKQGADRTGLASAAMLLLHTDATLSRARQELWILRGHIPAVYTIAMDDFYDRYEAWLTARSEEHASARFRDWVMNHYLPGPGRSELAWVTAPRSESIPANQPFALTVRATNRSADVWRFTPGTTAGIHLSYFVFDSAGECVCRDEAGLFAKRVAPGESVDLRLAIPKLPPGRYGLRAEMIDSNGAGVAIRSIPFSKYGDVPLTGEFEIR